MQKSTDKVRKLPAAVVVSVAHQYAARPEYADHYVAARLSCSKTQALRLIRQYDGAIRTPGAPEPAADTG